MTENIENTQSNNLISGHSISFDTGIAKALGINAAIIFNHIVYWLKVNAAKKDANWIQDKIWMYETQKDIAAYFDFMSEDEVYKALKKLVGAGLLIKDCFNKNPFDHTAWYTTSDQSFYINLKESLRNRPATESTPFHGRNQKPSGDGIRNRPATESSIHINNQEKYQENHHQREDDEDDFFSKNEEEGFKRKYSKAQVEEAKRITLEKCKSPDARKKYFKTVIENAAREKTLKKLIPATVKQVVEKISFPDIEVNIKIAERFIIEKEWGSLFIRDTYVEDKFFTGKDISLKMRPEEFEFSLQNLYDSLYGQRS